MRAATMASVFMVAPESQKLFQGQVVNRTGQGVFHNRHNTHMGRRPSDGIQCRVGGKHCRNIGRRSLGHLVADCDGDHIVVGDCHGWGRGAHVVVSAVGESLTGVGRGSRSEVPRGSRVEDLQRPNGLVS